MLGAANIIAENLAALPAPTPYQLPPIGWGPGGPPAAAIADPEWRQELKAGALRPRIMSLDAISGESLERRLEAAQTEQRAELSRRFTTFESAEKHFKDWVQREHQQIHSGIQQLKVSGQENEQQNQRQIGSLTAQCQKQDSRMQDLEANLAQARVQVQSLMNSVAAGNYGAGYAAGGGTGEQPQGVAGAAQVAASNAANLEVLRAGLEREASARVALSTETADQLKDLSNAVTDLSNRMGQQIGYGQQQLQQQQIQDKEDLQRQASRLASVEPAVQQLSQELEQVREQLNRSGADVARRCEEAEASCGRQLQGVQEAALSAARELWEEHQGVVSECKASLASLQQILDAKDKIASQLRSLQQQQRDDDRQELFTELQRKYDDLRAKVYESENALSSEQSVRVAEQQRLTTTTSRLGVALEKAQAAWIKESTRLATELQEAKKEFDRGLDGESRGFERRLAEGLDVAQRRLDDVERKVQESKIELKSADERLEQQAKTVTAEVRDAEGRLQRQVADLQTMQASRVQQSVFDMKAELVKAEQVAASERNLLRAAQEDSEAKLFAAIASTDTRLTSRIQESVDFERERSRQDQQRLLEEERASRLKSEGERMASLQRRLKAHEEQVLKHLEALREADAQQAERLRKQVEDAESGLKESVHAAEARSIKRLEDELSLSQEKAREELKVFMEDERGQRLKSEADRLISLQKRLQAHEDLTTQRLQEQRGRLEDALETQRQALETQVTQDRKEIEKLFHDFAMEQRQSVSDVSEEVGKVGGHCRQLAEDLQATQHAMDQRLESELAAIAARMAVQSANQAAAQQRAADHAAEVEKTMSDKVDLVSADLMKFTHEGLEERAKLQQLLQSQTNILQVAFDAKVKSLEERDAELSNLVQEATARMEDDSGRMAEGLGQTQEVVRAIEEKMLRSLRAFEELQMEQQQQSDEKMGAMEANLGEMNVKMRENESETSTKISAAQDQLQNLEKLLDEEKARATKEEAQLNSTTVELTTKARDQAKVVEKLSDDLNEVVEKIRQQVKVVQEEVKNEESRARDAEVALNEKLTLQAAEGIKADKERQDLRKTVQDKFNETSAELDAAKAELNNTVEGLRTEVSANKVALEAAKDSAAEAVEAAKAEGAAAVEAAKQAADEAKQSMDAEWKSAVEDVKKLVEAAESSRESLATETKAEFEKIHALEEWHKKSLEEEEKRATEEEKQLKESLEKLSSEVKESAAQLQDKVREAEEEAKKAHAEALKAEEELEAEKKTEAEKAAVSQDLGKEVKDLQSKQEEAVKALKDEIAKLEDSAKKSSEEASKKGTELQEKSSKELDELKKQLEELKKSLQDLQDRRLKVAEGTLEALDKDLKSVNKVQESHAKALPEVQKSQADFANDLTSINEKILRLGQELEKSDGGDAVKEVKEQVKELDVKLEGGFQALLTRFEAEKWLRDQVVEASSSVLR